MPRPEADLRLGAGLEDRAVIVTGAASGVGRAAGAPRPSA